MITLIALDRMLDALEDDLADEEDEKYAIQADGEIEENPEGPEDFGPLPFYLLTHLQRAEEDLSH